MSKPVKFLIITVLGAGVGIFLLAIFDRRMETRDRRDLINDMFDRMEVQFPDN